VKVATGAHENRASNTVVIVRSVDGEKRITVNQKPSGPIPGNHG
jgi:hypothetical protein